MKLAVVRFGCAVSGVWGLMVFICGVANLIWPTYAVEFLKLLASIYPGYHFGQWGFGGVLVATLYAIVDAWIIGVVLAWFYNWLIRKEP